MSWPVARYTGGMSTSRPIERSTRILAPLCGALLTACAGAPGAPSQQPQRRADGSAHTEPSAPDADRPAAKAEDSSAGKPGELERIAIAQTFFIAGEQMFFAISMRGVTGLQATMVVGQPGRVDGREVIVVRSQARTSGVVGMVKAYFEESTTHVDSGAATPIARRSVERYNGRETIIESDFASGSVKHTRRRDSGSPHTWQQTMPAGEPIFDNQTILGLVRAWTPEQAGTRAYFYAVTDEMLHRHHIRFTGYEDVRTTLGVRHARRYDVDVFASASYSIGPKRSDQSYSLWISDDIARMPLLVAIPHRYGRIEMELIAYSRPHPNGTGDVVIRGTE